VKRNRSSLFIHRAGCAHLSADIDVGGDALCRVQLAATSSWRQAVRHGTETSAEAATHVAAADAHLAEANPVRGAWDSG